MRADHRQDTFTEFAPLNREMVREVDENVRAIFDRLGGPSLLKSSRDVYIKPNAVGANAYVYTRPEVVAAAIRYWRGVGARNVYLFENSTQATSTRYVFELIGYNELCKRTGAIPIYLDEDDTVRFEFTGKKAIGERDPRGYELAEFRMPRTIADRLIREKDENLYVNIPKLKTHSMGVVTLGIKNQWGFPAHADRSPDHNFNLHSKIVDVLSHVQPDVTLIEGVEGTIYGHYPALALADECVRPFKVLIGGRNVVATDVVGARMLGFGIEDVPHIKLAIERGLGNGVEKEDDIRIEGDLGDIESLDLLDELSAFGGRYPHDLYPDLPEDVTVIKGKDLACVEGCVNNSLGNLQIMALDHHGKGGWTLMAGKGFDAETVDALDEPVFLVGPCAVEEVGARLTERLGEKNVYMSKECNDLTAIVEAMCHLMKVAPWRLGPRINPIKAWMLFRKVFKNNSHARLVSPHCHVRKLR